MVEHCGLEWSEDCLRFHEQTRIIKTASVWQARQTIYRSSQQRWRRYASHLGELAAALWDYLPEEQEALRQHGIAPKSSGWLRRLMR